MEVLQNRLNSFVKQKRGKGLKWPHPKTWKATPNNLAEAGFYFDPSTDDPDNVTCFMCDKQVTEWAEDDDPFDIHFEKCANVCPWASLRCGLRRDADAHGRFVFPDKSRLPTSKAMEKARLETFTAHGWKHDKNKKHLASSKKMAHAGFVFLPAEAGDDTGACLYCHVALGNWDEDDDPMQHHRDRDRPEDPCPFLALAFGSALPTSKPQAKQSKPAKRATKAKPLTHTDVLMPTKTFDGSDDDAPVPFPASVARTGAKTPRTVTRSTSRATLRSQDLSDEEVTPPPKKRGRSKSVSRPKVSEDDQDDARAASPLPPTRQRRPTTAARSRSKSVARPASVLKAANLFDDDDEPQPAPRKAARSRSKAPDERTDDEPARKPSRSRSKAPEADNGEQPDAEVARKPSRSKAKPKAADVEKEEPKRPSSRSQSKPQPQQPPPDDGTSSDDGWFVAPLPPPPPARSRAKSVSRPKGKAPETDVDEPAAPPPAHSRTKSVSRPKGKATESEADEPAPAPRAHSRTKSVSRPKGKAAESEVDEPAPPARSRTKSVLSRSKGKAHETDADEPEVVSRKEQKKKQAETQRPPSRMQPDALEAVDDPVVRKASRTKSKQPSVIDGAEAEAKKPSSRAKAKPPLSDEEEPQQDDEMEMEQYLPPASEKPRSKPSSKVEEAKAQRGRKPPSRSTSKAKFESVPAEEALEEEEEEPQPIEPAAPPPARTRKASTRSTAPVSRSTSTTAKAKAKTKRDPSPASLDPDLDNVHAPTPEYEQPEPVAAAAAAAAALPRQGPKSKPASSSSRASAQAVSVGVGSNARAVSPPAHKPRSTSQARAQLRASKAQKDVLQFDEQEDDGSSGGETGDGLPVVDISTDDEEPRAAKTPAKAKGKGKTKKPAVEVHEERTAPPSRTVGHSSTSRLLDDVDVDDDVEMAEVEESVQLEPEPLPVTPPRTPTHASTASSIVDEPTQPSHAQPSPEEYPFMPPLATDPFVDICSLSEAEQDMTVEEWIRYQMAIEYERFKRDGERQLGMFELRAEEARRTIETL